MKTKFLVASTSAHSFSIAHQLKFWKFSSFFSYLRVSHPWWILVQSCLISVMRRSSELRTELGRLDAEATVLNPLLIKEVFGQVFTTCCYDQKWKKYRNLFSISTKLGISTEIPNMQFKSFCGYPFKSYRQKCKKDVSKFLCNPDFIISELRFSDTLLHCDLTQCISRAVRFVVSAQSLSKCLRRGIVRCESETL